jgi:hypothetical protein
MTSDSQRDEPPTATSRLEAEHDRSDSFDPFAELTDEPDTGPTGTRKALLDSARRGYVPLRKVLVQKPSTEEVRASVLATLVSRRHHRPLDLLLLLHALQPILDGSPLPLATWARVMSCGSHCSRTGVTRAFETLADLKLVTRVGAGSAPIYLPLMEDGRDAPWTRAGVDQEEGPGYFTLPHAYWTSGWAERLKMPGKAMLLIMLAETQSSKKTTFTMAVERAHGWYGISERTAERGYTELRQAGLTDTRVVKVADPRHPAGRREVYHRALTRPFRTPDRAALQQAATKAARKDAADAGNSDVNTQQTG